MDPEDERARILLLKKRLAAYALLPPKEENGAWSVNLPGEARVHFGRARRYLTAGNIAEQIWECAARIEDEQVPHYTDEASKWFTASFGEYCLGFDVPTRFTYPHNTVKNALLAGMQAIRFFSTQQNRQDLLERFFNATEVFRCSGQYNLASSAWNWYDVIECKADTSAFEGTSQKSNMPFSSHYDKLAEIFREVRRNPHEGGMWRA
jgi:hypothetical protein